MFLGWKQKIQSSFFPQKEERVQQNPSNPTLTGPSHNRNIKKVMIVRGAKDPFTRSEILVNQNRILKTIVYNKNGKITAFREICRQQSYQASPFRLLRSQFKPVSRGMRYRESRKVQSAAIAIHVPSASESCVGN